MTSINTTTEPSSEATTGDDQATASSPQNAHTQLLHLDPRTLVCDRNISARDADATLLASVRDLGVLTPVSAVRTADGTIRLRTGHRRTAAAIAADLPTIPVIVAAASGNATDPEAADQAVQRLVEQWAENEHRTGLDNKAKVEALAQLSLLGLSAEQVAARTHVSREHAAAAVTVAASSAARRALTQAPDLDLTQAAAIAEFEDDPEAVQHLTRVAMTRPGSFAYEVATARRALSLTQARQRALALLAERGVPVIDRPGWGEQAVSLHRLQHDGQPLTAAAHADCPGRAAYLISDWRHQDVPGGVDLSALAEEHPEPAQEEAAEHGEQHDQGGEPETATTVDEGRHREEDADDEEDGGADRASVQVWAVRWACAAPQTHGHSSPFAATPRSGVGGVGAGQIDAEQAREAERAERRRVRENNAGWRIAEGVRRDFLRTLLTRKTAPKGAAALIATVAATHPHALIHHSAAQVTRDLLGAAAPGRGHNADPAAREALSKASEARALVITLGVVLGACEAATDVNDWRNRSSTTDLLLTALTAWGYERADVERLACGQQPQAIQPVQPVQPVHADSCDEVEGAV